MPLKRDGATTCFAFGSDFSVGASFTVRAMCGSFPLPEATAPFSLMVRLTH